MQIKCSDYKTADMQIFVHHIYEFKKGLRNLVLHTMNKLELHKAESLLLRKDIAYHIQPVTNEKINLFFGDKKCIYIIKEFGNKSLNEFTDEEDFILGIMLGYDRNQQCDRYIKKKERRNTNVKKVLVS